MNNVKTFWCRSLVLVVIWCDAAIAICSDHHSAGTSPEQGTPPIGTRAANSPADAPSLLRQIRSVNPDDLGWDAVGNVVSVVLRQGRATDRNLKLISTVDTVQSLGLEPSRNAEPSSEGIASLARLTNLVNLDIACGWSLREGVFRAACKLSRLRCLGLNAACPPSAEYACITNLQSLTRLRINFCGNFGDGQLAIITNLPNLVSLELKADDLSSQATNILIGMKTLTNIVFTPKGP